MTILYPYNLDQYLKLYKNCIPRLLSRYDTLELDKKYFDLYYNEQFKVKDIYEVGGITYYTIRSRDKYHCISHTAGNVVFELYYGKTYLKGIDIINNDKYYYGYEIIFWFYTNGIDLNSTKYLKFQSYVEYGGKSCINMNKKYKVIARYDKHNDSYYKIKFISSDYDENPNKRR